MIKKMRAPFAALTILLASATALVAIPDVAAARGDHDHKDRMDHKAHKDHGNDRHSDRERSHHHKKHKKHKVVCIKAPCPGYGDDEHDKRRRRANPDEQKDDKGCGKVIVPTAGCATPARDPVGNTRPSLPKETKQPTDPARKPVIFYVKKPGSQSANPPAKAVTVSNGVTTTQIQNGLGGVTAYSDKPGTITVTNGKEKTTLSGASVTLSGNVVGVGGGQGVQVGPRNGEGKTVVAIKRPAEQQRYDSRDAFSCFGCDLLGGVHDFAYGIAHGFAPGPAPSPNTSTTTQQ